ncbi:MAG: RecF/RecN/SMC N-terminal domain-containing protein [Methanobacterium sp. Maddingley MBC34]|nr:MAG: RecF/RecN/SMC N-terminal domain-containing protein [Methanobacterium sp. Maddingley MBC34]
MRIQELEICNFRGIKHLSLSPNGRNFLISGPNGSGKSAIVDAVDFLLTGDVSRMKGPGTKGIKLKDHAKHIQAEPSDCWVKATVKLLEDGDSIEIKRSMDKPRNLICDEEYVPELEPVQELALRGQHVLTRREILNYVTSDSGTRGREIQKLLKLNEVDDTRRKLVKVRNQLRNEFQNSSGNLNTSKSHINSTVQIDTFDEDVTLNFVNENREILGGEPLFILDSSMVKKDIQSPDIHSDNSLNLELLEKDLENLPSTDFNDEFETLQSEYGKLYSKIQSDKTQPEDRLLLTQLGLKLTGDTCPLCDTPWDGDELEKHLSCKLEDLQGVKKDLERMKDLSAEISLQVKNKLSSIEEVIKASHLLGLDTESYHIMVWEENLLRIDKAIDTGNYRGKPLPPAKGLEEIGNRIFTVATKCYKTTSPEQTAWDKLNRLEENLKYYEENLIKQSAAHQAMINAEILHDAFIESRDEVLDGLYGKIKDRFVELYLQLHGDDEEDFDAHIASEGAGVDFKVSFHGEGTHPPHALHSEGHQDSMGICLYLALAEELTEGYIDLIILDDVMMSVDAPHRRQICRLLLNFYDKKQFIITTHDQIWARQLRIENVVSSKGVIELYDWKIDAGPQVNSKTDMWSLIEADLTRNDVPAAAAKLRRGSEEFFRRVCGNLEAKIKFKYDGKYDFGELKDSAQYEYNNLLSTAIDSANSWKNTEERWRLKELKKNSGEIFNKFEQEEPIINFNVHFNPGTDYLADDFKEVVRAFHDLFSVFECEKCEGMMYLVKKEKKTAIVRCDCGTINWNLIKKNKLKNL